MEDSRSVSDKRDMQIMRSAIRKNAKLYAPEAVKDEAYYMARANIYRMRDDDIRTGLYGREDKNRVSQ